MCDHLTPLAIDGDQVIAVRQPDQLDPLRSDLALNGLFRSAKAFLQRVCFGRILGAKFGDRGVASLARPPSWR